MACTLKGSLGCRTKIRHDRGNYMSLKSGKCTYCQNKLKEGSIVGSVVMSGGHESVEAFCDEYCQSLHARKLFRKRGGSTLRFSADNHGSDSDDNGDNRNPSNDVEAMRDRID